MMADLVDELFNHAMKDQWSEVVELYQKYPHIREARITNSGETALHIAVSLGKTSVVPLLVKTMEEDAHASRILSIQNERGDTALHLAAALGNDVMCNCIANKEPKLVASRNHENETPIFLAALHGAKEAFSFLINYIDNVAHDLKLDVNSFFRNRNGDTILHSALSGEYYDFTYWIIKKFPELVNSVNENGQTPLHILASKPNSFYSSTRLTLLEDIIYSCILVEKLKTKGSNVKTAASQTGPQSTKNNENSKSSTSTELDETQSNIAIEVIQQQQETRCNSKDETQSNIAIEVIQQQQETRRKFKGPFKPVGHLFTFFLTMKEDLASKLWCPGIGKIEGIIEKKKKHTWASQIMDELVESASNYKYNNTGGNPNPNSLGSSSDGWRDQTQLDPPAANENTIQSTDKNISHNKPSRTLEKEELNLGQTNLTTGSGISTAVENKNVNENKQNRKGNEEDDSPEDQLDKKETAFLVAAKKGILEIVQKILDKFPVAIQDRNSKNKNVVLLAVESRQTRIYQLLLSKRKTMGDSAFWQVDNERNSALHLAAKCGELQPWLIPGGALQMQWEFKWYKFVKKSMPPNFFVRLRYNNKGRTPRKVFTITHKALVEEGRQWLTKTSEACSVVAALIATVAFGASTTVPGGFNEHSGRPVLRDDLIFNIFAMSSLIALCFSVTALIFFLTILTSRYQEKDFANSLPRKLLLGLTSLFTSIAAILISFCSGHSFVLKDKLKFATYPIYLATCLPMTYFALEQLPLYFDLIRAIFTKVPEPSH